jgi:hypothetical protein
MNADPYGEHIEERPEPPAPTWGVASGRGEDAPAPIVDAVAGSPVTAGQRTYPVPGERDQ